MPPPPLEATSTALDSSLFKYVAAPSSPRRKLPPQARPFAYSSLSHTMLFPFLPAVRAAVRPSVLLVPSLRAALHTTAPVRWASDEDSSDTHVGERPSSPPSAASPYHLEALSPWNQFIKRNYDKVQAEHDGLPSSKVVQEISRMWLTSPDNPQNQSKQQLSRTKPLNHFNDYVKRYYRQVLASNPDLNSEDIMKEMGRMWASSPENPKIQKRKPSSFNAFIKVNFAKFQAQNPDLDPTEINRLLARAWAQSPENPKNENGHPKPVSPFNAFVKQHYHGLVAERPHVRQQDILKELGQMWKTSPENPKVQKWHAMQGHANITKDKE